MALKIQAVDPDFRVSVKWPPSTEMAHTTAGADLDGSVGELTIAVRDKIATAFKRDRGDVGAALNVPLYSLAEWIALNWWPLLFEPGKGEKIEDDPEFRARHWMGAARDGFALPDLWFLPAGTKMDLQAADVYLRFARLTFTTQIDESVSLASVRDALAKFVTDVLGHLDRLGVRNTEAHQAWALVQSTTAAQEEYCRLIGSLGISPYDENVRIDSLLESLSGDVDPKILTDLFQAADVASIGHSAELAKRLYHALPSASELDIEPLSDIVLPEDRTPQAWRWGVDATASVRAGMGITNSDPQSGDAFFERLGLDLGNISTVPANGSAQGVDITAGLQREAGGDTRIAVVGDSEPHRRFAAARAAFIAWTAPEKSSRLITRARTRDQQASRAFAAEMLAPIGYIRKRLGSGSPVSSYRIDGVATELNVSPQVVEFQARNNRIAVV
ncbi:MAG TPA: hypothetical protein VIY69_13895 [Candidatus Acidoferrales bacterium]